MAEDTDDQSSSGAPADALAARLALDAATAEEAREYLRRQNRLADLQIDTLEKKDEFELSHLRFRRFSDYARFTLEMAVAFVVLLIVLGVGTMVWSATQDRDLVVDAFSVPPDIAQTGLTGAALANRVLDRVGAMDHSVHSFAGDFSNYRGTSQDIRVEIPDTGISIGELNRYLQAWLGHETHVTGELLRTPTGLSITTRYGGQPGVTIEGKAADLNALIQKSAETVFRGIQPLRYADYLSWQGRTAEGRAIAEAETHIGDDAHRAQAYVSLGMNDYFRGDSRQLVVDGGRATQLDPNNGVAWFILEAYYNNLDHEEGNLIVTRKIAKLAETGRLGAPDKKIAAVLPAEYGAIVDSLLGDYSGTIAKCKTVGNLSLANCEYGDLSTVYAARHQITDARNLLSEARVRRTDGKLDLGVAACGVQIDLLAGDYAGALARSKQAELLSTSPVDRSNRDVFLRPYEAEAMARTGDIAGARKMAAATPDECDSCIRARGRVEMIARNWNGAAHWFALASRRMPDIPFADTDWGQMLMAKGDLDGAIAKFESASRKGPHFADPLEMWGEAMIAKNRSDLALAKFEEANKYAPDWGRLHLKWGEALLWSGDKAGAKEQFAVARGLYLTPTETSECERLTQHV